jgi:zinc transport system substrate-binding protein
MARAYGLHQIPVEVLGKEPGSRQVTEFVRRAREDGIRAVFVQPQMASPAINAIASEVGAQVVTLDPLSGDYLVNMRHIADSLALWLEPGE